MVKSLIKNSGKLLKSKHHSILSAALIIATSYAASAILGLVKNRLLAGRFFGGLEHNLDVYFAALVIPDSLFQLLVISSISSAFIPVYQDYLKKSSASANRMANAALVTLGLVLVAVVIFITPFTYFLSKFSTHFDVSQIYLMSELMRIMLLAQLLLGISAFFTGLLQAHHHFLIPALAPIFYNLGIIGFVFFLSPVLGIRSAAWGMVLGALAHLLIQIPFSKVFEFAPRLVSSFKHAGVKSIIRLMPARSAALGLFQFERYIAVNLASNLAAGSLTVFSFARQLYLLPVSLFGVALGQASFPSLSYDISHNSSDKFKKTLSQSLSQIIFFALPASMLLLVLRIPLVRIVFGASQFPWQATLLTGRSLAILSLSIAPQAAAHLLTRAFYAQKDTKTPFYANLFSLIIFIFLAIYFTKARPLGIVGLSIALSVSNFINFILLYLPLRQRWGSFNLSAKFIKLSLLSFLTGLFLWVPMRVLDQFVFDTAYTFPLILLTVIASAIGSLVYLILSYFWRIEELSAVLRLVGKLGSWRQIISSTEGVSATASSQE